MELILKVTIYWWKMSTFSEKATFDRALCKMMEYSVANITIQKVVIGNAGLFAKYCKDKMIIDT